MDDLVGKVVTGRNVPGYQTSSKEGGIRITEGMQYGQPLTDAERMQQHYARYGTTALPPRGTGLGQQRLVGPDLGTFVAGAIIGFIIGGLLLTATGREIGYRAGRRVAGRI